jgi:hypothetical protein
MDIKKNAPNLDTDYFNFENDEFYEWATAAPTSDLVEVLCGYFSVLEHDIKTIDEDADFTDPEFLNELNGISWHFYDFGPWIMEIQDQLNRRYNLPDTPTLKNADNIRTS